MEARRELVRIRKELDWYHRTIGEVVLWAAYNPLASTQDVVYDEPGDREYWPAVQVQTLWISVNEAGDRLDQDRLDARNSLHLAVSAEALRNAGVLNVFNDKERIFDIIKYWDHYWSVNDFEISARFPSQDSTTIGITAVEVDEPGDYAFEEPTMPL